MHTHNTIAECSSCNNENYICDNCSLCIECCNCIMCDYCDENTYREYYCCICNRCKHCCICNARNYLLSHSYNYKKTSERTVGIEIELSYLDYSSSYIRDLVKTISEYKISCVEDPSCEIEFCTQPTNCRDIYDTIDTITNTLKKCGAETNRSTGLHVHIDINDFEYEDMLKLLLIYYKVEPILFSKVSKNRSKNKYCTIVNNFYLYEIMRSTSIEDLISRLVCESIDKIKDTLDKDKKAFSDTRYYSLNVLPYLIYGTIEFRLHNGTLDSDRIKKYVSLLLKIVNFSKKNSLDFIKDLVSSGADILLEIDGKRSHKNKNNKRS